MLAKRIVVALDVKDGRVVKGVRFRNIRDAGDPVELALRYEGEGADEIVFLDIAASHENRGILKELARRVSEVLSIPFTVGGGIRTVSEARELIRMGADKIFVNTAAVKNPALVKELAEVIGTANLVVAIDAKRSHRGWEVYTHGGRERSGLDAIEWARTVESLGAGELLVTSMDADGTKNGYDLSLIRKLVDAVDIPIIASGGAGAAEDFLRVFQAGAQAALAASIFHYGMCTVGEVKKYLAKHGLPVRLDWGGDADAR